MAEGGEDQYNQEVNARKKLVTCINEIEKTKPKKSDVASFVASFLIPSSQTDWKRIKYYKGNLKKTTKDNFKTHLTRKTIKLQEAGPYAVHNDSTLGMHWHGLLNSDVFSEKEKKGEELAAEQLVLSLQEQFDVKLLDFDFPLYGYVYNKEEKAPNIYLWQDAEADAIGWYYDENSERNKFVIVEWKVCDLVEFWNKSTTYSMYLHQGLVYARLLQLHVKLDYLPPILLVPISFSNGQDIQPGLFYDYPDECKEAIERDFWSTTLPKPPLVIQPKLPFKPTLEDGPVDGEMQLKDLFAAGTKVKDFLKALGYSSLQVREGGEFEMELE